MFGVKTLPSSKVFLFLPNLDRRFPSTLCAFHQISKQKKKVFGKGFAQKEFNQQEKGKKKEGETTLVIYYGKQTTLYDAIHFLIADVLEKGEASKKRILCDYLELLGDQVLLDEGVPKKTQGCIDDSLGISFRFRAWASNHMNE